MMTRRQVLRALPSLAVASSVHGVVEPLNAGLQRATDNRPQFLADNLLRDVEKGPRQSLSEQFVGVFTADAESSVDRFGFQFRYCIKRNLPMWSAFFKGSAPVPLDWGIPIDPSWLNSEDRLDPVVQDILRLYDQLAKEGGKGMGFELKAVPPKDAKRYFSEEFVAFLTDRFKAVKSNSLSAGVRLRVSTNTKNLRVRYTMAYFPNFGNSLVFGAPTSPVEGQIQPGRWRFGADGPSVPLKFDSGVFDCDQASQEANLNI